jgi:hypothetical protein
MVSTPVTWKEIEAALKKKDASDLVFEARDMNTAPSDSQQVFVARLYSESAESPQQIR